MDEIRQMQCPFCGHVCETACIGRVYCGPHKVGGDYYPAVAMHEIDASHEDVMEAQ